LFIDYGQDCLESNQALVCLSSKLAKVEDALARLEIAEKESFEEAVDKIITKVKFLNPRSLAQIEEKVNLRILEANQLFSRKPVL